MTASDPTKPPRPEGPRDLEKIVRLERLWDRSLVGAVVLAVLATCVESALRGWVWMKPLLALVAGTFVLSATYLHVWAQVFRGLGHRLVVVGSVGTWSFFSVLLLLFPGLRGGGARPPDATAEGPFAPILFNAVLPFAGIVFAGWGLVLLRHRFLAERAAEQAVARPTVTPLRGGGAIVHEPIGPERPA
jgi:hypothetical protein